MLKEADRGEKMHCYDTALGDRVAEEQGDFVYG
jgi:hypothetical protein